MNFEEAKKLLIIDKNSLDNECIEYSQNFFSIAEKVTWALNERDFAKQQLETIYAMLSKQIREEAIQKNEKITEPKVEQNIRLSDSYINANSNYLLLKLEADKWMAIKESFHQKAGMLKELCNLYLSGYFSEIQVKNPAIAENEYEKNKKLILAQRQKRRE